MTAWTVLEKARNARVTVEVQGDRLLVTGPPGTEDLINELRANKPSIMSTLQAVAGSGLLPPAERDRLFQAGLYKGPRSSNYDRYESPYGTRPFKTTPLTRTGTRQPLLRKRTFPSTDGPSADRWETPYALRKVGTGAPLGPVQRSMSAIGGITTPSAQAWRNMLPGEREMYMAESDIRGIPRAEFMRDFERTSLGAFGGGPRKTFMQRSLNR